MNLRNIVVGIIVIIMFLCVFTTGCTKKTSNTSDCQFKIKKFYTLYTVGNGLVSYFHDVVVENYDESCFKNYNFIDISMAYADTASLDTPISSITFYKPTDEVLNAHKNQDGLFNGVASKSAILFSVAFDDFTLHDSIKKIKSISFYKNGTPLSIDFTNYNDKLKNGLGLKPDN